MYQINVPSYNYLTLLEKRIRAIQELYDYIRRWKIEVDELEAEFKGTYSSVQELNQVPANANDYAWVTGIDSSGNTTYAHYRYIADTGWTYEYTINNPAFTTTEWAAIQSGITSTILNSLVNDKVDKQTATIHVGLDYTGTFNPQEIALTNYTTSHATLTCSQEYVYLLKPSTSTMIVSMNGISVPLEYVEDTTYDGESYQVFKTQNTYDGEVTLNFVLITNS